MSLLVLCGLAVVLAGCQNDEIKRYTAPKLDRTEGSSTGGKGPVRLLAAIVPHDERTWFFKLTGPADAVGKHQGEFDRFIRSVHFTDDAERPVKWTVPEGWEKGPSSELRYATFRLGGNDGPLELTVVPLGREAGSLSANVNRWREQLGLKPLPESEVGKDTREVKVDGATATLVDLTGPGGGKTGMRPPFASGRPLPAESPTRAPLTYRTPEGWKEVPKSDGLTLRAFRVGAGNQQAETTVIVLPGQAGGLPANVNRWRNQIGLDPVPEEQLRKDVRQIDVGGTRADYVDLTGPASDRQSPQRLLGVVVPRGEQTWFFKMKGPAALVAEEKANFEAFVQSVRFTGANHE